MSKRIFVDMPYNDDTSDALLYGTVQWQNLDEDQYQVISDTLIHSLRNVNESIKRHGYVTADLRDFNRQLVRELGAPEFFDDEAPGHTIPIPTRELDSWQAKILYGVGKIVYRACEGIERIALWFGRVIFQMGYDLRQYLESWADRYHE